MTTYLGKSCSFGLPRVPFVNCGQFMYLVISLFGFEGRMWDLIVSVPDHCLSFYFTINLGHRKFFFFSGFRTALPASSARSVTYNRLEIVKCNL